MPTAMYDNLTAARAVAQELLDVLLAEAAAKPEPAITMNSTRRNAVESADAYLNNVGLPTYSDLLATLRMALRNAREALPAAGRWQFDNGGQGPEWMHCVRRVLRQQERASQDGETVQRQGRDVRARQSAGRLVDDLRKAYSEANPIEAMLYQPLLIKANAMRAQLDAIATAIDQTPSA